MKTKQIVNQELPESLYSVEMEERLETINLPAEALIENCCIDIFTPCLCNCDCKTPSTDDIISVN